MNKHIKRMILFPAMFLALITGGLVQAASPLEADGKKAYVFTQHKVLSTKNELAQKAIVGISVPFTLAEVAVRAGVSVVGSVTGSESIARFGLNDELVKARAILEPYWKGERNIGSAEEWKPITKNMFVSRLVNYLCTELRTPNEAVFV